VSLAVAFTEAARGEFGAGPVIRALRQAGVPISASGYYAARSRPPSARAVRDAVLEKEIARVFKESGDRYGARKVRDQLAREGIGAARCTVERLMRRLGLRGVRRGGYKVRTTNPDPSLERPPDRVERQFAADAPDRLWVVDFTYVPTWEGTAYTALVTDVFARLIPGWRTSARHDAGLVLDALAMAVAYRARQGAAVAGLVHHSDAGSEYLSIRYSAALAGAGIIPSVGTVGDSYDNALAETIIGLYKTEVIDHQGPWETIAQVEAATGQWVSWYNTRRLMGPIGNRPPAEYEQAWRDGTLVPQQEQEQEGGGHGRRSLPEGGLRPHPPGLRPGPRPSSEMARAGGRGKGRGRASPRRLRWRCRGTPGQVKGASGVQAMTLRVTLDQAAEPAADPGAPDEEMPAQPCHAAGTSPAGPASQGSTRSDGCSIKQEREISGLWFRRRGGYRGKQASPGQTAW
jgi:putative transposase